MDFSKALEKTNDYLASYNTKGVVKVIRFDSALFLTTFQKNSRGESFSEQIYNFLMKQKNAAPRGSV